MSIKALLRISALLAALAVAACSDTVQPIDSPDFAKSAAENAPGQWALSGAGYDYSYDVAYTDNGPSLAGDFSVSARLRLLSAHFCEMDPVQVFDHDYASGVLLIVEGADCYGPERDRHLSLLVLPTGGILQTEVVISGEDWHTVEAGRVNGRWFISLDGEKHDVGAAPSAADPAPGTYVYLGAGLDGEMDNVEIRDLAANRTVEQWRFEEASGATATGRNGTVLTLYGQWVWVPTNTSQSNSSGGGHSIDACGTVISSPGNYVVTRDLINCPEAGILVRASDVTIRLKGHTIDGVGGSANGVTAGIGVPGGVQNITIEGPGDIRSFFGGLVFEGVANSTVVGVTVHHNTFGLPINAGFNVGEVDHYSSNNVFRGVKAYYNIGHGFTLNGSTNSLFENNDLVGNGGMGILLYAGGGNTVRGNRATQNYSGIWVESNPSSVGHVITGNTSQGNWVVDMVDRWGDCAHDTWSGNTFNTSSPSCIQ